MSGTVTVFPIIKRPIPHAPNVRIRVAEVADIQKRWTSDVHTLVDVLGEKVVREFFEQALRTYKGNGP